ncbi:HAMP domain-containing protein [Paenibacillus sp. SYP-B3998]|uniref:HAMP domain-containing protein n=1 Tax=Paenibacillus sp. SYP-B3998 TaxID=2678564 RepID=A0A6G3ZRM3_9BACL|nr:histidine kinase [Paenibacillus sp. SYP-B3998]NEW04765.1 HAMP domain-containing protein [Paenibacillus sp. SYP-B3998]
MRRSLRYKLIIGFMTIAIPLVILLMYNNLYASSTVREQVAESNKNAIILYSNQIQAELNRETNFLYNLAYEDPNIALLSRTIDDPTEYILTKGRIINELNRYHRFDSSVDFQFIYSLKNHDLFNTLIKTKSYDELITIQSTIEQLLNDIKPDSAYFQMWKTIKYGDEYALVRLVDTGEGYYLGASVRMSNLMIPLDLIQLGQEGYASFLSQEGNIIANREMMNQFSLGSSFSFQPRDSYQQIKLQEKKYIVVTNPIKGTDTLLSAFIPERKMLQKLTYFQGIIFIIPVLAAIVLCFYLFYLNNMILRPLNNLIQGMRKIKQGDWKFRLHPSKSREFTIINEAFNDMALQIHELKINVYEEQIKAHKAEVKHLQLQINPHFLLNSMNIVYNLAQIKKYDIIQLMCLNLMKYFRFTTQTHRNVVTIAEEMEHMESYINIQQLRFPERITYTFDIEKELEQVCIPPLLIQPFIENCMKYGFDFMEHPFQISIRILTVPDSPLMKIVISDNGAGFSEEVLTELHNGLYFATQNGDHLGIWNVYHRLKFIFGQESNLLFNNVPDSGANVTILMPIRTLEQFN